MRKDFQFYILLVFIIINPVQVFANTQGLWVGQIEINKVNEVISQADNSTPKDTSSTFDMTVLLHMDYSGKVCLLREVTMMNKEYDNNGVKKSKRVLITDDSLLSQYKGIIRKDGKLVGVRIGSLAFDFNKDQHELELTGEIGAGKTITGSITLSADHPSNPFKHLYHPDHQEGWELTRNFSFIFDDDNQVENDFDSAELSLNGTFKETITGLHKIPIKAKGTFIIKRISLINSLIPPKNVALLLDGKDNYVNLGDSFNFANASFTIEFWTRRASSNSSYMIISHGGTPKANSLLHIGFRNTNKFTFAFYANDLDTSSIYRDFDCHHWACSYDSSTKERKIYRDGVKIASDISSSNYLGTGTLYLGKYRSSTYYHGSIDELRIWGDARTTSEINDNMYKRLTGNENDLVAYYHFDYNSGTTLADISGNEHHGTLINIDMDGLDWMITDCEWR